MAKKRLNSGYIVIVGLVLVMFSLSFAFSHIVSISMARANGMVIVIDPGHGARDGGSVGANGTIEKDINLRYGLALKDKLVDTGFYVEMTRKNDEPLYSPLVNNKKQSDMQARMRTIKRSNPNLVISVHMNSFPLATAHGATVYYRKGDESGHVVADIIQKCLHEYASSPQTKARVGDYYILNASYYTAVLIEFGFLSNPSEESMLNTDTYMEQLLDAVVRGVVLHFGNYQVV